MAISALMSSALSGLQAAQTGLTTVSNNITNVNPPFANSGSGTANGSTLGRMFIFDLRKTF